MKPLPSLKHRSPINVFRRGSLMPKRAIKPEPIVFPGPDEVDWEAFDTLQELMEVVDHFIATHSLVLPADWQTMTLREKKDWLIANV